MSVRNFERVFMREVGQTPSHYVLQMRVEAARRQLEHTDRGLKQLAVACGFGSEDLMRPSCGFWGSHRATIIRSYGREMINVTGALPIAETLKESAHKPHETPR